MKKHLLNVVAATLGLWIASVVVPGVSIALLPDTGVFGFPLTAVWELFLLLGIILGFLNFFIKPILKALTLPLEILTLGLFSLVINVILVWLLDVMFKEVTIPLIYPLVFTSLIVWALNFVLTLLIKE